MKAICVNNFGVSDILELNKIYTIIEDKWGYNVGYKGHFLKNRFILLEDSRDKILNDLLSE